jgi:hypothetical protein
MQLTSNEGASAGQCKEFRIAVARGCTEPSAHIDAHFRVPGSSASCQHEKQAMLVSKHITGRAGQRDECHDSCTACLRQLADSPIVVFGLFLHENTMNQLLHWCGQWFRGTEAQLRDRQCHDGGSPRWALGVRPWSCWLHRALLSPTLCGKRAADGGSQAAKGLHIAVYVGRHKWQVCVRSLMARLAHNKGRWS